MYVGVEAGWWSAGGDVEGYCVAAEWASVAGFHIDLVPGFLKFALFPVHFFHVRGRGLIESTNSLNGTEDS